MRTLRRLVALAAGVVCLVLAYRHFVPSQEARIRRLLGELAKTVSIPAKPSTIGTALALDKLRSFFTRDVQVEVDLPFQVRYSFSDRDELMQAAAAAWSSRSILKVEFLDIGVELDPAREKATAELTARATQAGNKDSFLQEFRFQLEKQDNEWRITRAETVRVLR